MDDLLRERMEQDAEKAFQLRSRIVQGLNVPPKGKELVSASLGRAGEMIRLRPFARCGLAGSLFEHPEGNSRVVIAFDDQLLHELFRPARLSANHQ
jgi:hypothetical protein